MKLFNWSRKYLKPVLVIALLAVMLGAVVGCEEYGFAPPASEEKPEEKAPPATVTMTRDRAILAVYEHLLGLAESHEAKIYLAEFYATCDNWTAESEFFKDGSDIWYILVDMAESEEWEGKSYWQQASWFVFRDGKVVPSNLLGANALRIEADLQELSLEAAPVGELTDLEESPEAEPGD